MLFSVSCTFSIAPASPLPSLSETLYEDESFPSRELAAVVASKVFYHLEELDDALRYALGAGPKFDVTSGSEYVQTLLSKCVDEYIRLRMAAYKNKEDAAAAAAIDPRLVAIVERMFDKCFTEVNAHGEICSIRWMNFVMLGERGQRADILLCVCSSVCCVCVRVQGLYRQMLGIALESRRLDLVQRSIMESGDVKSMLSYCFTISQSTTAIASREFRTELLRLLVDLYQGLDNPDYINMCQVRRCWSDSCTIHAMSQDVIWKRGLCRSHICFFCSLLFLFSSASPVVVVPEPTRQRCAGVGEARAGRQER